MFHDDGWLFVYRCQKDFDSAAYTRNIYTRYGLDMEILDPDGIHDHDPGLKPIFRQRPLGQG
ncbi:hypothetical protein [uncultured Cohaesibacter sp.]|uniref:hypothetical protein n=1 Tax=uncultured Cohaesibacter sp. TaxID=1002546 RepID=UPI0029C78905|nr:hypothetical protein [uncultured Cohaesibacter sp.]